jgi:hypothetical protein
LGFRRFLAKAIPADFDSAQPVGALLPSLEISLIWVLDGKAKIMLRIDGND